MPAAVPDCAAPTSRAVTRIDGSWRTSTAPVAVSTAMLERPAAIATGSVVSNVNGGLAQSRESKISTTRCLPALAMLMNATQRPSDDITGSGPLTSMASVIGFSRPAGKSYADSCPPGAGS